MQMHGIWGYAGWQWMFILEAMPAVIFGIIVLFYLTDKPEKAKWLNEKEREWLINKMSEEQNAKKSTAKHGIFSGLADIRVLALAMVYFGTSAGLYTLGIWARHSDKTAERTWHVVIACMVAALGLILATTVLSVIGIIFTLTIVNIGISCSKPPLWSMPTLFLSGSAAAAGIATINSIGNLGGFFGSGMIGWIKDVTGSYSGGLYFVAGLLVFSSLLTIILAHTVPKNETPNHERQPLIQK